LSESAINLDESDLIAGLVPQKEQLTQYKQRNKPYVTGSSHPADKQQMEEKGWTLQKEGKRTFSYRKPKSHDKLLEDRVWCFLYKMGYSYLNKTNFIVPIERDNGTKGRKQIDVFCCDSETAFVIECKSKTERGKRSLQKDLEETRALQEYLRKSIYALYGDKAKPRIIWAYATQNIIWSEPDLDRANDAKISIITENELQYFEAFLKHMGPAGRYQILGEFLKGQKVPGLGEAKIPAVKGKIGKDTFYSFVATPRRLMKISFINHQALNHPDGRPAYQRMINSNRIKKIGEFIEDGGYFPTNVLVNFTESPKFDLISNKENTDPNIKFGWLTLPNKYRSAWVIDGQHRLYGYSHLEDKFLDRSLFVLAFDKMDTIEEARLFITINSKQKSVPPSLLINLLADLGMDSSDPKTALTAIASGILRAINNDKASPLTRRFTTPGVPPEKNQNLTVSELVKGLTRSGLIGKATKANLAAGPLSGGTDLETIERARKILNAYFEEIMKAHPKRWEEGNSAYISTNPGIRAHFMLISEIVKYLSHKKSVDFETLSEDKFAKYVIEIAKPVFDFIKTSSDEDIKEKFSRRFGEGGVKDYLNYLLQIIHEERSDFGTEEFLKWVKQTESSRVEEASSFIMKLSELMIDSIISVLKRVHGTKRLDSGDYAFWEYGVESTRVRDNAYNKQQADKSARRQGKEAYLDIIDLIDIIKQKNNWPYMEPIFNFALPTDKKGSKYYLSWIHNFNELRKIAAHKNSQRTYSDEDLEFLGLLSAEIEPRLKTELKRQ